MSYVATRDGRKIRSAGTRAPAVPDRIDDLHGHSVGVLEVPHHMACGHASSRRYDLDDPAQLRHAYEQVLCEAAGCNEVQDLINPSMLRKVWRDLHLPSKVREAWETRHPTLRRTVNRTKSDTGISSAEVVTRAGSTRPPSRGFSRRTRVQATVRVV
ncbi:hypothetical protein [Actinoplanes regularis]|uniref:Uncharacterized protein n=1 Tax=Actinoplanes regularis TaxID=52697 RepID=A0A239FXY4_9ACTN|nr:hypothetical protein [Actinoplanes regularis]GIE90089.1 hypothetical protein Are01nite_65690 [Actinoplanes regularis]SNS61630.1 hypothetical protein SAMN06264365_11997 [Actinoplanes regularis]